ncbi:MAG TPA: DeoR family transcriptional regulator [Candidatus Paceibacterota bacterium]|jgi:hypothetical protein|nr:DeoR family transcriptional regulator [Candidatus Paceibacterota bacterium]
MNQINSINKGLSIKDNDKGHKIAAALYLVTNHLSDNDPLKSALRTSAIDFVSNVIQENILSLSVKVQAFLETAVLAGLISEKNASIISLEIRHYAISITTEPDTVSALFAPTTPVFEAQPIRQQKPLVGMTYNVRNNTFTTIQKSPVFNENKSKRQEIILSYIKEHKSAGIKDIAALFTDTGEKTIQRELSSLVTSGKITKRGEKRWSVYMII